MKSLIAFFEIPVVDFGRAITFYETIFGCKLSVLNEESEKMAFFTNNTGECLGSLSYAPDFNPSTDEVLISFFTVNIETTLDSMKNKLFLYHNRVIFIYHPIILSFSIIRINYIVTQIIYLLKFMPMNDLIKMKLFRLLSESSQVTNEEMQNAYRYFTEKIENLNQSDKDYQTVYRILSLTRIEFQSLQTHILYEQGGKWA